MDNVNGICLAWHEGATAVVQKAIYADVEIDGKSVGTLHVIFKREDDELSGGLPHMLSAYIIPHGGGHVIRVELKSKQQ